MSITTYVSSSTTSRVFHPPGSPALGGFRRKSSTHKAPAVSSPVKHDHQTESGQNPAMVPELPQVTPQSGSLTRSGPKSGKAGFLFVSFVPKKLRPKKGRSKSAGGGSQTISRDPNIGFMEGGRQSLVSFNSENSSGVCDNNLDAVSPSPSQQEEIRKISQHSQTQTGRTKKISVGTLDDSCLGPDVTGAETDMNEKSTPLEKVILNVGGRAFCTFKQTLKSVPRTRLYELMKCPTNIIHPDHYDEATNQYFFDRHPGIFEYILNYYRTGELHVPRDICWPIFNNELAFWGLDHTHLEACCWQIYRSHEDHESTLRALDEEDKQDHSNDPRITDPNSSKLSRRLAQLWELCDDPMSSQTAKAFALLSLTLILASVALFCLETHEYFVDTKVIRTTEHLRNGSTKEVVKKVTEPKLYLWYIESVCVAWFCFEILVRFISCPNRWQFVKTPLNLIDFLAVLPFFFSFVETSHSGENQAAAFLRVIRILRVFRVFKLTRHSTGLKILWHTLHASMKELFILGIFMCLGVVIFASLIYYAERLFETGENEVESDFKDIPHGFWWAIVTMTTLGYGDMVPKTFAGQMVGSLCALCGLLTIALPVPVIVSNFSLYYSHYQAKNKLPRNQQTNTLKTEDEKKEDNNTGDEEDESSEANEKREARLRLPKDSVAAHAIYFNDFTKTADSNCYSPNIPSSDLKNEKCRNKRDVVVNMPESGASNRVSTPPNENCIGNNIPHPKRTPNTSPVDWSDGDRSPTDNPDECFELRDCHRKLGHQPDSPHLKSPQLSALRFPAIDELSLSEDC